MLENLYFYYDGVSSRDMGVINVATSGLIEEKFIHNRSINKSKPKGMTKSSYNSKNLEDLTFTLQLFFSYGFNEEEERTVKRWLDQDYYKPLYFEGDEERIYYCLVTSAKLTHNGRMDSYGRKYGILEVEFECNSPYIYSPYYIVNYQVTGELDIQLANHGDIDMMPSLYITKVNGAGDVSIVNLSNGGSGFTMSMADNEEVLIDNERKDIVSDTGLWRYDQFTGDYLSITYGVNRLKVTGDCYLTIKYCYRFL